MSENILTYFEQIKAQGLSIDITRGKPDEYQLDLANELLSMNVEPFDGDVDLRNYGEPFGIQDARILGSDLLSAPVDNVITGEQSSLMLTYQMILSKYLFAKPMPWKDIETPKFICPVPGFDRHFNMLDELGIEMLSVPLVGNGLDLDILSATLAEHDDIVGLISVPRHSNPSGDIYSDKNILNIFELCSEYSEDLIFLFDQKYLESYSTA